jgi:hypothetical protein
MAVHKIKKPENTFQSDYVIKDKKCYAIFETPDDRVHTKLVCKTEKLPADWRSFDIRETKRYFFINLGD